MRMFTVEFFIGGHSHVPFTLTHRMKEQEQTRALLFIQRRGGSEKTTEKLVGQAQGKT